MVDHPIQPNKQPDDDDDDDWVDLEDEPMDKLPPRRLFLKMDVVHIMKNVRSQLLEREFLIEGNNNQSAILIMIN